MEHSFDQLLRKLGIKQSDSKRVRARHDGVCFGWQWDLRKQTVAIPPTKYTDICTMVLHAVYIRCVTLIQHAQEDQYPLFPVRRQRLTISVMFILNAS